MNEEATPVYIKPICLVNTKKTIPLSVVPSDLDIYYIATQFVKYKSLVNSTSGDSALLIIVR